MERKATIQDFTDALGMAGLLVSVNGETPCNAVMALYTDDEGRACAAKEVSSITYNSKEVSEGALFVCKGARFKEKYLEDALRSGAVCYVREDPEGRVYVPSECSTAEPADVSGIFSKHIRQRYPESHACYSRDILRQTIR